MSAGLRRIGHKGADAIAPGNTLESIRAAVDAGVDMIELDVLRPRADFDDPGEWRTAAAGPGNAGGQLLVAHDWADAARREPLTLAQVLDELRRPPLDSIEIDLDIKVAGREDEIVAALRDRDMLGRAMTSTMEVSSVAYLAEHAPDLRRGWTVPKTGRDWPSMRWARPLLYAGLATLRARLPRIVRRRAPVYGLSFIWAYHAVITPRLIAATHGAGCELIAWTVDDAARIAELTAIGVDGICTNDPRLFDV